MTIKGYDKAHALRTAKMCTTIARRFGHSSERIAQYELACLLHDLGRVGLEPKLFGAIWSWAREQGIPTRPAEWRTLHKKTPYGQETAGFLFRYRKPLEQHGIKMNSWACEQVEMRLGFAHRMRRQIRMVKPRLQEWGLSWKPWMTKVTLYYYYPEQLTNQPSWVRELGEILVACEQLEAYSNRQRGKDYYQRDQESFRRAFSYLSSLIRSGHLSKKVVQEVRSLTAHGWFNPILESSRGTKLTTTDKLYLRNLAP